MDFRKGLRRSKPWGNSRGGGCGDRRLDPKCCGKNLAVQVTWFDSKVDSRLALFYIHQINEINSYYDFIVTKAP